MLLHHQGREARSHRAVYRVIPSLPDFALGLGEQLVTLCVETSGPMRLQDYLTPEDADELADALRAVAAEVRSLAAAQQVREGSVRA
jgi:hypothetical protein